MKLAILTPPLCCNSELAALTMQWVRDCVISPCITETDKLCK